MWINLYAFHFKRGIWFKPYKPTPTLPVSIILNSSVYILLYSDWIRVLSKTLDLRESAILQVDSSKIFGLEKAVWSFGARSTPSQVTIYYYSNDDINSTAFDVVIPQPPSVTKWRRAKRYKINCAPFA